MPTGYTAAVEAGEITEVRDFILLCARAFGALIEMRDEPLSEPIPEKLGAQTSYYEGRISALSEQIALLVAMSLDEALTESLAANNAERHEHQRYLDECRQRRLRHEAMQEKVEAWDAPESHSELKQFMADQLKESLRFVGGAYPRKIAKIGEEWRNERLANLRDELRNAEKRRAEELDRAAQRQKWLDDLRASLPPLKQEVQA